MSRDSSLVDRLIEQVQTEAEAFRKSATIIKIIAHVAMPSLLVVWSIFKNEITQIDTIMFWVIFITLILMHSVIVFAGTISPRNLASDLIHDARLNEKDAGKFRVQLDSYRGQIEYFSIYTQSIEAWFSMLHSNLEIGVKDIYDLETCSSEMASIIIDNKAKLFHINDGEHWSFAIYLFDDMTNSLHPIWRSCSPNHPARDWMKDGTKGRTFLPGEGQIGRAFMVKNWLVHDDITDPLTSNGIDLPMEKRRIYDDDTYVSISAGPIGPNGDDSKPYGVFIGSSNKAGRFDYDNSLILRHFALFLANLIHGSEIDSYVDS